MESCGPYTLVEKVGQGALAEVWRGVKVADGPGSPVYAVKRVLSELELEPDFTFQYTGLGSTALPLAHPNVVRTADAGQQLARSPLETPRHFAAQEFVTGVPLNTVLNQLRTAIRDIPRAFSFYVVRYLLEGLAYAHRAVGPSGTPLGVFHGDVCPANVFVAMDGTIKLSDFCISRARWFLVSPKNAGIRYRFHYMAPETARDGSAGARSDLYAVAVMLHEMLAQRRFRRGNTPEELGAQARAGTWPTLASLNVATDPDLDAIFTRGLQDNPAQRYQSAEEMLHHVGTYMQARGLLMHPSDVATMMQQQFAAVLQREQASKSLVDDVFGRIRGDHAPATIEPAAPPAEEPAAPPVEAPAQRRTRPKVADGASRQGTVRLLLGGILALVAVGGVGLGVLIKGRDTGDSAMERPRDLSRLVGGRTVLFWSERVSALDADIAKATRQHGDANHPDVQALKARREDTVRKAKALGLADIEAVAASQEKPAQ